MKKLRSGIKLTAEIEGFGRPIEDLDRFDAVLKFYRNKGDALIMDTVVRDPIPYITSAGGEDVIAWGSAQTERSNVVFERGCCLARQADLLPGVYYSILGMKQGGYRSVAIPPHLFAHSMHEVLGIDKESVVKMECFLTGIRIKQA